MPVHAPHAAAERHELGGQRLQRDQVFGAHVGLELVAVDDEQQIVQLLGCGHLQRLPDCAFVQLAVAGDDDDAVVQSAQLAVHRHTDGHGR